MALLVRAAPERHSLRRIAYMFLWLTTQLATHDELSAAFAAFSVAAAAAQQLAEPSRRHALRPHLHQLAHPLSRGAFCGWQLAKRH